MIFALFLGIAVVHEGLTNAWKILYSSLSQATVTTVDHRYVETSTVKILKTCEMGIAGVNDPGRSRYIGRTNLEEALWLNVTQLRGKN